MAADRIVINRSLGKADAANLIRAADMLCDLCALLDKINNNASHGFNGADYTIMEADFSLNAGAGANATTLIGLMNTIFNTATDVTGANRQAQIQEFKGRVSGQ